MVAAVMIIEIHLPYCHSLKDKRKIIRGIRDRIKSSYNMSFGELDYLDKWQRSKIGFALICNDMKLAEKQFDMIKMMVESTFQVNILNVQKELY